MNEQQKKAFDWFCKQYEKITPQNFKSYLSDAANRFGIDMNDIWDDCAFYMNDNHRDYVNS